MFPVVIHDEDKELPKDNCMYVIADNGVFKKTNTGIYEALVPCSFESIKASADSIEPYCKLAITKMPQKLVWQAKHFFAEVVEKFGAESVVVICYNRELDEYKFYVPQQRVSRTGIFYAYKIVDDPEYAGYDEIGTIHSHCDFDAFHSGTDDRDEHKWDGIHITFGHNNQDNFTITSSLMVTQNRFTIDSLEVMEGIASRDGRFFLNEVSDSQKQEWIEDKVNWIKRVES